MAVPDLAGHERAAGAGEFNSLIVRGGIDQLDFGNYEATAEEAYTIDPACLLFQLGRGPKIVYFQLQSGTSSRLTLSC